MKISISYPPLESWKGTPLLAQNRAGGFSRGHVPWNKGKTGVYSEEVLSKMKRPKTEEHKRKISFGRLKKFKRITEGKIRKFKRNVKENKDYRIAFGEILGTIPSDAYFKRRRTGLFNYILASKDREFVEKISDDFAEFGVKTKILRRISGLWYIEVCRRWFKAFLPYLKRENDKWVFSSKVVNSSSNEFKAAIIRSFADAEGTVTCTIKDTKYYGRHISIYNGSKKLLLQLKEMLSAFGILSRFYLGRKERKAEINGENVKFSSVYYLQITNYKNLSLFHNSIGFGIARKREKLEEIIDSYKRINRQYTVEDYKEAIFLYEKMKNCKEVSRQLGIPPQTIRNWALHGVKPRLVKIYLNDRRSP